MSTLGTLWNLLDSRQRWHLFGLQLLSIAMALSTVGGVAAVLPFFAALSDPDTIRHNALAWPVLQKLNVGEASIVPVLGAAFAAIVLLANAINLFGLLAINRFSVRAGETLYAQLFAEYLRRGFEFHARRGSSVLACLTDCVASFPAGYDQRLGQTGRGLSGGERQRVAIARALYRDASLRLVDEATSSLDSTGESEIGEMLQSLLINRTILIVAHRAGALRHCNIVYELAAGGIVGQHSRISPVSLQAGNG